MCVHARASVQYNQCALYMSCIAVLPRLLAVERTAMRHGATTQLHHATGKVIDRSY